MIKINMNKAIEIRKELLRQERIPLFAQLDVAFMRALEEGDSDSLVRIKTQKQLLRDITKIPELLSATNVEDLSGITLESGGFQT
jgi:hypothetical protein